jgi:hypothetical protein
MPGSAPYLLSAGCYYVFMPSTTTLLLLSVYFLARTAFCDPGIIPRREYGIEERFLEPHPNNLSKARCVGSDQILKSVLVSNDWSGALLS